jgi:pyruvate/2-oxoglutarate dehydrogenase complex dihydrolipoamide acyltransferase (E2) component
MYADSETGRTIPLSMPRKMVADIVHFAKRIPTVPVQRTLDVSPLMAARERAAPRIGWCALFTKAYALVCEAVPELRQAYVEYPWPRLYQHPHTAASVAVERNLDGAAGVFFAHIIRPEAMSLADVEAALADAKTAPVREKFSFYFRFYKLPRFLRRLAWWYLLNLRGGRKAVYLGTFSVSVYSSLGAESLHPLSPLTTTLNYGTIGDDGRVTVRIIYDHRALDGATVARALARLEEVLHSEIARELETLSPLRVAASA